MRIGTEAENITGLRLDSCAYMYVYDRISDHSHMLLCARGWDCKQLQIVWCTSDFFLFFIFRGQIGQELFEMFKIDNDSTWASDMDVGWEYFSCEFGIWLSDISKQWYFDVAPSVKVCAPAGLPVRRRLSYRASWDPASCSVCGTAAYGAWELGSPDGFGGGGREGPLAHGLWRAAQHRSVWRRKKKFNITIEIARAYGKFSNLNELLKLCACISAASQSFHSCHGEAAGF